MSLDKEVCCFFSSSKLVYREKVDSRFSLNSIAKCLETEFKTRIYYKTIVSGFILHTFDNFGLRFFFLVVVLLLSFHLLLKYHISRIEVFNQLSLIVLYNTSFTLIMSTSLEKDVNVAFENWQLPIQI